MCTFGDSYARRQRADPRGVSRASRRCRALGCDFDATPHFANDFPGRQCGCTECVSDVRACTHLVLSIERLSLGVKEEGYLLHLFVACRRRMRVVSLVCDMYTPVTSYTHISSAAIRLRRDRLRLPLSHMVMTYQQHSQRRASNFWGQFGVQLNS